MTTFRAFRIHNEDGRHRAGIEELSLEEPGDGEVLIRTRYSNVNYKDALAGTGRGKILRHFPLTGGVDSGGEVIQSQAPGIAEGDQVLVTGFGMSAVRDGGYAEYLQAPAEWVTPLPEGLSLFDAMALGTAGLTVALSLQRMELNGQDPAMGPIIVTGASGGVGSLAVDILTSKGYSVVAVSGKPAQQEFLKSLGATEILGRDELPTGTRPLEKGLWGGAIDNVGGEMLATLTRHIKPGGNIASIGLAGGIEFTTTVMPFIIRAVNLLGINSVDIPSPLREELWVRLATDMRPPHLEDIIEGVIPLDGLAEVFEEMMQGKTHGRILVKTF